MNGIPLDEKKQHQDGLVGTLTLRSQLFLSTDTTLRCGCLPSGGVGKISGAVGVTARCRLLTEVGRAASGEVTGLTALAMV